MGFNSGFKGLTLSPTHAYVFQVVSFPGYPTKPCTHLSSPQCYMPHPYHFPLFHPPKNILSEVQITKLLIMQSSPFPRYFVPTSHNYIYKYILTHTYIHTLHMYMILSTLKSHE